jgi:hypothetical protein
MDPHGLLSLMTAPVTAPLPSTDIRLLRRAKLNC